MCDMCNMLRDDADDESFNVLRSAMRRHLRDMEDSFDAADTLAFMNEPERADVMWRHAAYVEQDVNAIRTELIV